MRRRGVKEMLYGQDDDRRQAGPVSRIWRRRYGAAGVAGLLCFAAAGLAAANSVNLTITGRVPVRNSIAIMPMPIGTDPETKTRNGLTAPVARFSDTANSNSGFTVTVMSENAQRFGTPVLADGNTTVPYTLSYGDQPLQFDQAEVTMSASQTQGGLLGAVQDLRMSTNVANQEMAQLSDTLHFIIRAN